MVGTADNSLPHLSLDFPLSGSKYWLRLIDLLTLSVERVLLDLDRTLICILCRGGVVASYLFLGFSLCYITLDAFSLRTMAYVDLITFSGLLYDI